MAVVLGFLLLAVAACEGGGLRSHSTSSTSMAPLIPRNSNFKSRAPLEGQIPQRGDVVVFKDPSKGTNLLVKRIVAIEGDEVEIVAKELKVNGSIPIELYVSHSDRRTMPSGPGIPAQVSLRDHFPLTRVGQNQVFVLGDNRDESVDSRFYGAIEVSSIVGYVVLEK